jgi:plasmid maintenance system antidote protein VapI
MNKLYFSRPYGTLTGCTHSDPALKRRAKFKASLSGRTSIADTALRLGKYFGVTPETWLDLQSDYDLRILRLTKWSKIETRIRTIAA